MDVQAQAVRKDERHPTNLPARYFAYGSNMDPMQMRTRVDDFTERVWAVLNGYALRFNKMATGKKAREGEGKGNVVYDPKGMAEGALYKITCDGLKQLDEWEKGYGRKELEVNLRDGSKTKAWVYIAQDNVVKDELKPTKLYLSHYLKGWDLLSPQYFRWLENTETLD
jgi:cation transport regulator ChaC